MMLDTGFLAVLKCELIILYNIVLIFLIIIILVQIFPCMFYYKSYQREPYHMKFASYAPASIVWHCVCRIDATCIPDERMYMSYVLTHEQ